MENIIVRYLQDAIAAEQSFETQLHNFATEATIPEVKQLFQKHAAETKEQHQALSARLKTLGGGTSGLKSFVAQFFGLSPKAAQIGHIPEERTVQDLIMAYSVENVENAMYECLIIASQTTGDQETASLAQRIQSQERQTAEKLWPHIASAAVQAFHAATASTSARDVIVRYLQDAEAAEENFEDALKSFGNMGDQLEVKQALSAMSRKAATQHVRLEKRLQELGATRSVAKSVFAHLLAFSPVTAQIGQESSEKNTQHLMITYAAAAAEMGMYEALASASDRAADLETSQLARSLQKEEKEDHMQAWNQLAASARASFHEASLHS